MELHFDASELTKREDQVAQAYARGQSYRDIAEELGIAPTTVRTHLQTIYRKLGVNSKVSLLGKLNAMREGPTHPAGQPARTGASLPQAGVVLPNVTQKPTIAVLPFANLSSDPDQEFFADGLTEDIIARLGYLRGAVVTSRTSAFAFKGRSQTLSSDISEILGARYLVEGSVRTAGNRVRITAKLVDGPSNTQMWNRRFDRQMADIFDLQDEITHDIVESLQIILSDGDLAREPGGTRNLAAWEYFHQGALAHLRYTPEDVKLARDLFARAANEDPDFIDAKVFYAWTYWQEARSGFASDPAAYFLKTRTLVDDLLASVDTTQGVKHLEAALLLMERRFDDAIPVAMQAMSMGPSRLFGYTPAALVLLYCGDFQKAAEMLSEGIRKIPYTPTDIIYNLSILSGLLGNPTAAVALAEEYIRRVPDDLYAHTALIVALQFSGASDKAKLAMITFRELFPNYRLSDYAAHEPFRDKATLEIFIDQLREAGLPN